MTFRRRLAALAAAALCAAGCRQDMHDAPRYEAYEANPQFPDGRASRVAPAGTVARGLLRDDEALYTGKVGGELVEHRGAAARGVHGEARALEIDPHQPQEARVIVYH